MRSKPVLQFLMMDWKTLTHLGLGTVEDSAINLPHRGEKAGRRRHGRKNVASFSPEVKLLTK